MHLVLFQVFIHCFQKTWTWKLIHYTLHAFLSYYEYPITLKITKKNVEKHVYGIRGVCDLNKVIFSWPKGFQNFSNGQHHLDGIWTSMTDEKRALGITVNSLTKVSDECVSAVKKANSTFETIRNRSENRDANIIVPLYKWCNHIWILCAVLVSAPQKGCDGASKSQRRTTKRIKWLEWLPHGKRLRYLELFSLEANERRYC